MAKEQFITRHVGPRSEDVEEMLKVIGVKSVDELIEQTVPAYSAEKNIGFTGTFIGG